MKLQRQLGGDALIGRRLHGLLAEAGFSNIALSLAPELHLAGAPSFAAWIENQIGIFQGCARDLEKRGLAAAADVKAAVAELRGYAKLPRAATLFAWNRARAEK